MMTNLFSTFDPSTSMSFHLNWMSLMLMFLFMPYSYWLTPSKFNIYWNLILKMMYMESKILFNKYNIQNNIIFIAMMIMILINNFMGLFPYIFTATSQMLMTLTMSLTLWMTLMIYGWTNKMNFMFAHLVPLNTPVMLMSFMVLIESISNFIRPGTLAIRLTANMIAGHLLLTLIGSTGNKLNIILLIIMIMFQIMLFVLEMSVSIIQSYVFYILSILYTNEI
uniref:ATP synthase subunit a n=1 Tax=Philanthus triangulum TaxID=280486 RepID=H9A9I7_9HYME|nr:ATP synthase F0 subunit 6 [Philanthus triangulum]AET62612.1 ATP synthase F0 subunit 6 [Philanthus triangulum]QNV11906.1 ATP synthase F0 subunit 6 [Philanthus triangulum]